MHALHRTNPIIPRIRGSYLNQHYPGEYMQNLSHDRAQPGKCIKCYRDMAQHEMHPPGRITPRAICPKCWAAMTSNLSQFCWVCGSLLDQKELSQQQQAPQDLHHRIHGEKCADYFSLVSAKALGVNMELWEEPPLPGVINSDPPQITYEPQQTVNDIINMVPVKQPAVTDQSQVKERF